MARCEVRVGEETVSAQFTLLTCKKVDMSILVKLHFGLENHDSSDAQIPKDETTLQMTSCFTSSVSPTADTHASASVVTLDEDFFIKYTSTGETVTITLCGGGSGKTWIMFELCILL